MQRKKFPLQQIDSSRYRERGMSWFYRSAATALFFTLPPSLVAAQQSIPAPNCGRASTAVEKAICTIPELSTSDAAMANAYSSLKAGFSSAQQSALLTDQRRWLRYRDALCADKSDRDLAGCLLAQTNQRRWFLAGEWPNRAPGAPRLLPAFFQEVRKGRYEINVVFPRIEKPRSPSESAFESAAHGLVLSNEALSEVRGSGRPPGTPMPSTYDATYDVTYLDSRLAAVVFTISTYGAGAAHPITGRESLIFDLSRGRALTMADILGSPAAAVPAISARCKSQIEAQAAKDGWKMFDDADFAATVRGVDALGARSGRRRYSVRPLRNRGLCRRSAEMPAVLGRFVAMAEAKRAVATALTITR
jgi:uncharacterized protein YecT (DUF1311 family)